MKLRLTITLGLALIIAAGNILRAEEEANRRPLTIEERLEALEQRNAILERKYENDEEAAAAKAKADAQAVAKDGFALKSADGSTQVKISGLIQSDYRDYLADAALVDQFMLRRVRPTVEGTINKVLDFRVTPEFASSFQLLDAYGELKTFAWFKVRAGKFKPAIGLERLQSGAAIAFVERAQPTSLVPNRDTGLQIAGDSANGVFTYQLGLFNGVTDGGTGESDTNDGKDYTARVFIHPFKSSSSDWVNGLGVGVAGSVGDQTGNTTTSNLPSFRTNAQQTFFSYSAGTFANGDRKRVVPQAYWAIGSLGLLSEYALSSQEVTRVSVSTTNATINNHAYQVAVTFVLTGERASFRGVKPRKAFDPKNGGWGALELTGRYSELKVDDEVFVGNRYASSTTSAKRAKGWTGGFNWYLSNNTKVVSNYEYTTFVGGAADNKDRPHERAIFSRVQFTY